MATISKHEGAWIVRVEGRGTKPEYKSFKTKAEATAWAQRHDIKGSVEAPPADVESLENTTLGDLLKRYAQDISTLKRGASPERYRIARMLTDPLCKLSLAELTSKAIATYRDKRLKTVSRSTVRSEMSLIRRALELGRREWGVPLTENPAALVTLPSPGEARDRRLEAGELERLEAALADNPLVRAVIRFAIETAMRRGEIIDLKWRYIDFRKRLAYVKYTKTGNPRTVPLTDGAIEILKGLEPQGERVFPITETALRYAWDKACKKARIKDLRFHDIRHESVSRFFEMGLSVPQVALISGHRTPSMLYRYVNLRPYELARHLVGKKWKRPETLDDVQTEVLGAEHYK